MYNTVTGDPIDTLTPYSLLPRNTVTFYTAKRSYFIIRINTTLLIKHESINFSFVKTIIYFSSYNTVLIFNYTVTYHLYIWRIIRCFLLLPVKWVGHWILAILLTTLPLTNLYQWRFQNILCFISLELMNCMFEGDKKKMVSFFNQLFVDRSKERKII